jgi:hypothetical protein
MNVTPSAEGEVKREVEILINSRKGLINHL